MSILVIIVVIVEVLLVGTVILLERSTAKKNKISFQETLELTDLPIVTFYNNGRKLNFILDTGANESVINERELSSCIYEKIDEKRKLMGIDGNNKDIQTMVKMTLVKGIQEFTDKFQVSNLSPVLDTMKNTHGVSIHGIIGNTFFTKYGYILDFDELAAYTH